MAFSLARRGVVKNQVLGSTGEAVKEGGDSMGSARLATPPHSSPVLQVLPVLRAVDRSLQQSVAASSIPGPASYAALSDVMPCIGQGCAKVPMVALTGRANATLKSRVISLRMSGL